MRASAALRTGTPRTLVAVAETVVGEEGVKEEPDGLPLVVVEELGGLEGQPEPAQVAVLKMIGRLTGGPSRHDVDVSVTELSDDHLDADTQAERPVGGS